MCQINYEQILKSYGSHNRSISNHKMISTLQTLKLKEIQKQELNILAKKNILSKEQRLYVFIMYFDNVLNKKAT